MVPELRSVVQPSAAGASAVAPARGMTFHQLLSELNPLQYLPVIGTIYRSLTGDTIPETARTIGSMVVSGLMGGPIGIAMNVAALAIEKATGLDPEKIGHNMLASIGIGGRSSPATATQVASASTATPWSPRQLAAYGVTTAADGTLQRGSLQGSDVLNDLELSAVA